MKNKYCYRVVKPPEQLPNSQSQMDIQLVVAKKEEVHHSFELYSENMGVFFDELRSGRYTNVIMTGFLQEHINEILPHIKDTISSICLFKCQKLKSFDFMAECKRLTTVEIYWNQKATALWDVSENGSLHTLIIDSCNALSDFAWLERSTIRHLELWGCNYLSSFTPKITISDLSIFQTMPNLEVLRLTIVKNADSEKDLTALSKLSSLKEFSIQDNYFSKEQFARLKSMLPNTKFL